LTVVGRANQPKMMRNTHLLHQTRSETYSRFIGLDDDDDGVCSVLNINALTLKNKGY